MVLYIVIIIEDFQKCGTSRAYLELSMSVCYNQCFTNYIASRQQVEHVSQADDHLFTAQLT